jgi:hypothetical protein
LDPNCLLRKGTQWHKKVTLITEDQSEDEKLSLPSLSESKGEDNSLKKQKTVHITAQQRFGMIVNKLKSSLTQQSIAESKQQNLDE